MFGKRRTLLICTLLTATLLVVAANECWFRYLNLQENRDVIFQSSTISALLVGVYDGNMTCKELNEKGDFGLGTFQGLDGEMIELDGRFYQVKVDGAVYSVDDSTKTPFAVVTFFESERTVQVEEAMNCSQLEQYLDSLLPTKNIMYAVKMVGRFTYLKTRSVPKQNPPYPRLSEVVKNQAVFEFHNVTGTVVGFRFPDYMDGVNVPGYHFHFISKDRSVGGHLVECLVENIRIELDHSLKFRMLLPENAGFYEANLTENHSDELEEAENT